MFSQGYVHFTKKSAEEDASSFMNSLLDATHQFASTVCSYLRANLFVAMVPFFVDCCFTWSKAVNATAYLVGFETWNQWASEEEDRLSGKQRPRIDKTVALLVWAACILVSELPVKLWLLVCPFVYLSGNNTPIKELYMCHGIYVHFYFLNLVNPPLAVVIPHIVRHAVTGSIQDLRDVSGDRKIGRTTLPMLFDFQLFYAIVTLVCFMTMEVPVTSLVTYAFITLMCKYPTLDKFCYNVWQISYVVELFLVTRGHTCSLLTQ